MDDLTANRIVFGILLVVVFGIVAAVVMIFRVDFLDAVFARIKNNSGNVSGSRMVALAVCVAAIAFLVYWFFQRNPIVRPSLTRSPQEQE